MTDKVCRLVENMVYEFNDLKRKELFTDKEIITIANKRRNHEYTINSSSSILLHFILYIEFEMNLEKIREKRKLKKKNDMLNEINEYNKLLKSQYEECTNLKAKMEGEKCPQRAKSLRKLLNKNEHNINCCKRNILKVENKLQVLIRHSLSDYSLVKRIINIFQTCLRKHHNNIEIWLHYFNFCYVKRRNENLESAILNSLKYHIKNELIWVFYLHYFYNVRKNIQYTRKLYIRAILFISKSLSLNVLYFNIEFDIFYKLLKNFKQKVDQSSREQFNQFVDFCKSSAKEQNTNDASASQTNEDILKRDIDQGDHTPIKDEDKYGLDVIIFLGNKYLKTFQNEKGDLYIFIFLLLNVYLKMEKNEWIKNYVLRFDHFKELIFSSIERYKQDQPCFFYYLFVSKCVASAHCNLSEDKDFQLLKNQFYKNGGKQSQLQSYFDVEQVNHLLRELMDTFHNDLMIYFFCLLLENLFETFVEYNNVEDVFTIDGCAGAQLPLLTQLDSSLREDSKTGGNQANTHPKLGKESEEQSDNAHVEEKKNILFHMNKPTLTNHEELQIFQFLKDEIFLCGPYNFKKINEEYLKERDSSTYHFLHKLNFVAYVCLFENRHSDISKNNFIYNYEQISQNSDALSSILYFFLFDPKKVEAGDMAKKKHHLEQPDQVNEAQGGPSKRRKKALAQASRKGGQRRDVNSVYESDSDNMSGEEGGAVSSEGRSEVGSEGDSQSDADPGEQPNPSEGKGSSNGGDDPVELNTQPTRENETAKQKISIIDELLSLLSKDVDVFVKVTILKCVLKLIIFLDNNLLKRHFSATISQECKKVRGTPPQKNFLKVELANLTHLYKKAYSDECTAE
ncbi:U3 small nucleolar RNA-associated protein 6, putative [Plasmodium vivax]|nr:U3 small nucleolar RNA-associated protein 6, putative [Plasmodium vivax]